MITDHVKLPGGVTAVLERPGARLVYEVSGDGPAVVLIHGFGLDMRMWDPQIAPLAARFRVVRYDCRGFGASGPFDPGVPYTHAGDLVALLDHLGLGDAVLAGLSFGGRVALQAALAAPDRVRGLALLDAVLDGVPWDPESVVVGSPATDLLAETAARLGIWLSVGVDERDDRDSTIYNTLLHFAPDGTLAARHRKLMPTGGERLVWGMGDGSTLQVVDTGFGRLGGLICWENYMPLARAALYAQGIDVYLAPTWDNSEVWVPTLRHIAREGRTYVIGVTSCISAADLPADLPGREGLYGDGGDWLSRGNTVIVGPGGDILAGPLTGEEGVLYAEIDTARAQISRQQFDPVGHYGRSDVFRLVVDASPRAAVSLGEES